MYLNSNQLSGSIPHEIGNLTNLYQLNLNTNQLSGSIPGEIGNLTKLNGLNLNTNKLSGSIPREIGNLINLTSLNLDTNQLSGNIPYSLGNLVNLTWVWLNNNQLSSSIPSSFGNLTKLGTLNLSVNQLTGIIPLELGNLVHIHNLYLHDNKLTGSITSSFGNLTNLENLLLSHNKLGGEIPDAILNIHFYALIDISYNYLTFTGLELFAQKFTSAIYSNQAKITVHQNGNALQVSAGGTLGNNTYGWFRPGFTDTTIITGDSVFYPSQSGTYYVKIINAIATKLILKSRGTDYVAGPAFIFLRNDVQQVNKTAVFTIYPNPAKDILHIQIKGKANILLTNQAGKTILTKTVNNKAEINVSTLSSGLYYIKNIETGKVQKLMITR